MAALYGWLVTKIELLSATHGAGRDRRWHEAFRVGAAEAIAERLADANRATHDAIVNAAALVTLDAALAAPSAAVDRFVEQTLQLGKGRAFLVDARAFRRGRAEGARAPLAPPKR